MCVCVCSHLYRGLDRLSSCHGDGPGSGPGPRGQRAQVVGGQRLRGVHAVHIVGGRGRAVGTAAWRGHNSTLKRAHTVTHTQGCRCTGECVVTWCVLLGGVGRECGQKSFRLELLLWNVFCGVVRRSAVLPLCYKDDNTLNLHKHTLPVNATSRFVHVVHKLQNSTVWDRWTLSVSLKTL